MLTFKNLNHKNYWRILIIGQQWGGVCTFQATDVMPPDGQI